MSTAAADASLTGKLSLLWKSTIGKKAIMAATGAVWFGYVVGHLLGNLQIYLGKNAAGEYVINNYAEMLHHNVPLLWGTRILLIVSLCLHVPIAIQLTARSRAARPRAYEKSGHPANTLASRTMAISGIFLLAFIIFHILHLTTGQVHPNYLHLKPYQNLVTGMHVVPVAIGYIVMMFLLGMHLIHGLSSMFQSLGLNHPKYNPWIRRFALGFATFIVIGNMSIPISILAGIIH